MRYVVYCDESRHNGPESHRYMAIGGLWVPQTVKSEISHSFSKLRGSLGFGSEIKWHKVSQSRLDDYRRLVDFFFDCPQLYYRVIIVDRSKVNLARYHGGDRELSFYKFYFQMLKAWISSGNQYLVLLDFQQNRGATRYKDLANILGRRAKLANAEILDLTVIDSSQTPLAQLCDLLTGAVAASFCLDMRSAKAELAAHIAARSGLPHLKVRHLSAAFTKFNLFRINLG